MPETHQICTMPGHPATWGWRQIGFVKQFGVSRDLSLAHATTSVNSRTAFSRLTLQTLDLHARKTDYRRRWGLLRDAHGSSFQTFLILTEDGISACGWCSAVVTSISPEDSVR
jgi:hypothetical protein